MQRRDPSEIRGLPYRSRTARLGGVGVIATARRGYRLPRGIRPRAILVLVAGVILLKGVIAVFVGHLVLDKAEIDRHLVDRAGHPSALRRPWPVRSLRRTLPDEARPAAEQRRTDANVCRTGRNGVFQIAAHSRRHYDGFRISRTHRAGDSRKRRECLG